MLKCTQVSDKQAVCFYFIFCLFKVRILPSRRRDLHRFGTPFCIFLTRCSDRSFLRSLRPRTPSQVYKEYYDVKTSKRRLAWSYGQGNCNVKGTFGKGKVFELQVRMEWC